MSKKAEDRFKISFLVFQTFNPRYTLGALRGQAMLNSKMYERSIITKYFLKFSLFI